MAIKRDHHPTDRRDKQLTVMVTASERDIIRARAAAERTSVSGLLATLGTTPPGRCTHHVRQAPDGLDRIEAELAVIRRHLSAAGNNLNQVTRWMHTNATPPPDIEALVDALSALATRVSVELTRLRRSDGTARRAGVGLQIPRIDPAERAVDAIRLAAAAYLTPTATQPRGATPARLEHHLEHRQGHRQERGRTR